MQAQTIALAEQEDRLLTLPEAAGIVGRNIKTLRRWIYAGHLPATKGCGKYGRFKVKESDLLEAVRYEPKKTDETDEADSDQ